MTDSINNTTFPNRPKNSLMQPKHANQEKKSLKPHSWPELLGLFLIAAIAIFVIVSIERIAIDIGTFESNSGARTTLQLERLQLRLESVQKILQLGLISQTDSTLLLAHHETKTIQEQLDRLLPLEVSESGDGTKSIENLRQYVSSELILIESLFRTGASGFTPNSAPVLRLIVRKINSMIDKTQNTIRNTALSQSANIQVHNKLLKEFSDYSTLFLTIFGLFAAGLLALALYQRQLFSDQLNANQRVDEQTRKLWDTVEGFSSACAIFDAMGQLQTCNSEFQKLLPANTMITEELKSSDILDLLRNKPETEKTCGRYPRLDTITLTNIEKTHELFDHQDRSLLIYERPTQEGGTMCTYQDISYIHRAESRLKFLDNHDKLTQLPNRNRFLEDLAKSILQTRENEEELAVVIFDIHNFKEINDTYGHTMGDRVLQAIASTIQKNTTPMLYTARIGGDEFGSMIPYFDSREVVEGQIDQILIKLRNGFTLDNINIPIQASTGIAYFPEHGTSVNELVNSADAASMHARSSSSNLPGVYNNKLKQRTERRRLMERHLHHALDKEELRVQYQPQIDVRSGLTTGMEALLRWNNSAMGEISPAEFIPLAEDNGLIMDLGDWVLKRTIADYQQLARYGMSPGTLSINLSRRQFNSNNIASTIETAIEKAGLTPQQLTLEITETAIMDDASRTTHILHELKEMGVGLSIDDFGVGYSSFAALLEFPIDEIKIDRLFVNDVVDVSSSQEIIRAIIDVAHALKAEVVAEGIENRKQFEMIKYLGCHRAQGFFLCEPVEATTFPDVCLGGRSIPNV